MTGNRLTSLIVRKISGELTEREAQELDAWTALEPSNKVFLDRATDEKLLEQELDLWKNIDPAQGYAKWLVTRGAPQRSKIRRIIGWSAAASLLIAVTIFSLSKKAAVVNPSAPTVAKINPPVLPGKNTATLTLSGGQQILLDSVHSGELAMQGNVRLVKTDDKSISYAGISKKEETVLYNTLSTPRSGQYQLVLPDGTHVWLNNVSTLRYPTSFHGADRTVELLGGEAYFEIAKDATKPFFVKVKEESIQVLGTAFNVKAYDEDGTGIQTTLLSGAVRVKAGETSVQLKPDEQARSTGAEGLTVLKGVLSQDIASWKNGFFYFGRASLREVMLQLARWYDVEVVYQGKAPDIEFGGKIDRNLPLNELLNFLDKNQVHFHLEGRKIIVLP